MKRRDFIALVGSAAAWPAVVRAQQPKMPVIGLLCALSADAANLSGNLAGFHKGLNEVGFVEGRDVSIEYRWANGGYDRLPELAADLVGRRVAVIAALASSAPGRAAKAATSEIPIVFQTAGDPVEDGLVASMSRPSGNVTGVTRLATLLEPKRLAVLHELVPAATAIAYLVNTTNPAATAQVREMEGAARALGLQLEVLNASTDGDVDAAFATMARQKIGALLLMTDPFFGTQREHICALAVQNAVAVADFRKSDVATGSLVSYAADLKDSWRQAGDYVGRVLKGKKPSDLPVVQPTKFELVVNLRTAKAIGLAIPESLLALADEVIE